MLFLIIVAEIGSPAVFLPTAMPRAAIFLRGLSRYSAALRLRETVKQVCQ